MTIPTQPSFFVFHVTEGPQKAKLELSVITKSLSMKLLSDDR